MWRVKSPCVRHKDNLAIFCLSACTKLNILEQRKPTWELTGSVCTIFSKPVGAGKHLIRTATSWIPSWKSYTNDLIECDSIESFLLPKDWHDSSKICSWCSSNFILKVINKCLQEPFTFSFIVLWFFFVFFRNCFKLPDDMYSVMKITWDRKRMDTCVIFINGRPADSNNQVCNKCNVINIIKIIFSW